VVPTYATAIPYIDRYLLDGIDNQYNWVFLVVATMFSAILAFLTDAEPKKELAAIKVELVETRAELAKTRSELVETRAELLQEIDSLKKANFMLQQSMNELHVANATIQVRLNATSADRSSLSHALDRHEYVINIEESTREWPYSFVTARDVDHDSDSD